MTNEAEDATTPERLHALLAVEREKSRKAKIGLEQQLAQTRAFNRTLVARIGERDREIEIALSRASRLLDFDHLTGAATRRRLEARMHDLFGSHAVAGRRVLLIKIDIDTLKSVNTRFSYEVGDRLLRMIVARLQEILREEDVVARLGGDKFAILCTSARLGYSLDDVCERVLGAFATPFVFVEQEVDITCSIGAVSTHSGEIDQDDLYHRADIALDLAKRQGGGCYVRYEAGMTPDMARRGDLTLKLRTALRSGDLDVYFQPKVEGRSGRAVALEALARWPQSDGSFISPASFVPIAEDNGLIQDLGLDILRKACRTVAPWIKSGRLRRVAVNLSPRQLDDFAVIDRIKEVLTAEEFEPSWLELEVTESCLLGPVRDTSWKLKAAHDFGFSIALDDFGTGYSNLNCLKRLPLDVLKIDRSFVENIEHDANDRIVVEAIVALAHSFALRTVAEGVETAGQCALLLDLGCDEFQGHYFAPAMDAETCQRWLSQNDELPYNKSVRANKSSTA